jgi:hypothetical protein
MLFDCGVDCYFFVCACRSDSKEAERKKMAELLKAAAAARAAATGGQGPQMWVLDLQVRLVWQTAVHAVVVLQSCGRLWG